MVDKELEMCPLCHIVNVISYVLIAFVAISLVMQWQMIY